MCPVAQNIIFTVIIECFCHNRPIVLGDKGRKDLALSSQHKQLEKTMALAVQLHLQGPHPCCVVLMRKSNSHPKKQSETLWEHDHIGWNPLVFWSCCWQSDGDFYLLKAPLSCPKTCPAPKWSPEWLGTQQGRDRKIRIKFKNNTVDIRCHYHLCPCSYANKIPIIESKKSLASARSRIDNLC